MAAGGRGLAAGYGEACEMTSNAGHGPVEARLRDIQMITDAALSQLEDQDFLAELVDRVKAVLRTDTAAVLLLDRSSGNLVATAAAGLEEEVRQGVRIPVGRGFAGRIAVERRPVALHHVDHSTVLNPILMARGIHALLGVPMVAGGRVIGVMHVGSLTPREFTADDIDLLQLAADRAATVVQSLSARADRVAVTALQESLLPAALPVIRGAQLAARYVPGRGVVGGDWYDVFTLPSGELGVVIGDVAGSGLPAAVIMGRMRSALRSYALRTTDPGKVLDRLDQKMQHFEPEAMATVAYAVFDRSLDRAHIASAGHLPPVFATAGQAGVLTDVAGGLMIGVDPGMRRRVTTVKVPPGALLCFYTDGLVERPETPLDEDLASLCQAVTAEPPEDVCAAVMAAMVGTESVRDDVALLVLRREPLNS